MEVYTIWIGKVQVNDHYLTKEQAEREKIKWEELGYDNIKIETWIKQH